MTAWIELILILVAGLACYVVLVGLPLERMDRLVATVMVYLWLAAFAGAVVLVHVAIGSPSTGWATAPVPLIAMAIYGTQRERVQGGWGRILELAILFGALALYCTVIAPS